MKQKEPIDKLIIKNYSQDVSLDYVFSQIPIWAILSEAQDYRVVTYFLDGEEGNVYHQDKKIFVVRTLLSSGTYKIEVYLEDEENINAYAQKSLEELN